MVVAFKLGKTERSGPHLFPADRGEPECKVADIFRAPAGELSHCTCFLFVFQQVASAAQKMGPASVFFSRTNCVKHCIHSYVSPQKTVRWNSIKLGNGEVLWGILFLSPRLFAVAQIYLW
jgi:hypothetical protein